MSDETITLPLEAARVIFDALVATVDCGSGFLDTEDVEALRLLATAIGVDPNKGTPASFVRHYPHSFKPMVHLEDMDKVFDIRRVVAVHGPNGWATERNDEPPPFVPCEAGWPWCAKGENHPIHQAADEGTQRAIEQLAEASRTSWPDGKTQQHVRLETAGYDPAAEMGA